MKRQTQNVRTMVYSFGSVPARVAPVGGEDLALAQLRLAKRLWNVLVTVERHRVANYRRIMRDEAQEEIDKLRERKDAVWTEIRALRAKARAKIPTPVELASELARVKAALAMLLEHQKATRDARHEARRAQLDALAERAKRRIKRARQAAGSVGLYWGTYNAVVQSADAARKHGGEMHYRGFRGEGTLTAQIIGGAATAECIAGGHSFFEVEAATPGRKWRYARVRVGSTENRAPKWLEIPIVYHREIPVGAEIKSVSATRRIVAGKVRWSVNVTVTLPPVAVKEAGERIAVDIGWRLLNSGVRVAYWQDEQGRHGEALVPASDIAQFHKVRDLRSLCDRSRDEFLPLLVEFLAGRELDEEWKRRAAHLAQWRSSDRLAALVRWWGDHRLEGDGVIREAAVEWRKGYLHLADWWRNQQEQMTLRVREQYRRFASDVASRYSAVILEDFDLRTVVDKSSPTEEQKLPTGSYRQMVSPSLFRGALVNACRREGVEVRVVEAAYTTSACHVCQHVERWDQIADIIHRCGSCGALWDQDHNAAINLLASSRAALTADQQDSPGIPPLPEDRSQTGGKEAIESVA